MKWEIFSTGACQIPCRCAYAHVRYRYVTTTYYLLSYLYYRASEACNVAFLYIHIVKTTLKIPQHIHISIPKASITNTTQKRTIANSVSSCYC